MGNDNPAAFAVRCLAHMLMAAAFCTLGACGSHSAEDASPATTPGNVTLTPAQRQHITLYTVAVSDYHRSIDTTGVVDFDQDHATQVLAAFSGPVRKLLVAQGDKVIRGQPLAIVISPDFADTVATYRKAVAAAANARKIADHDADMLAHRALSQRETEQAQTDAAGAEADRDRLGRRWPRWTSIRTRWPNCAPARTRPKWTASSARRWQARWWNATSRPANCCRPAARHASPSRISPACGSIAQCVRRRCGIRAHGRCSAGAIRRRLRRAGRYGDQRVGGSRSRHAGIDRARGRRQSRWRAEEADVRGRAHRIRGRPHTALLVPVSAVLRDDENLPFVYVVQARRQLCARAARRRSATAIGDRQPIASRPAARASRSSRTAACSCASSQTQ